MQRKRKINTGNKKNAAARLLSEGEKSKEMEKVF